MIRTIKILLAMIILSSIYGEYIFSNPEHLSLATFHLPMVFCDFLVIFLLHNTVSWPFKTTKIEVEDPITLMLTVLLGLSIVNMGVHGFAWFYSANGIKDVCDTLRQVVCIIELLVLAGGGYYHRIFNGYYSGNIGRHWLRNPRFYSINGNGGNGKCN